MHRLTRHCSRPAADDARGRVAQPCAAGLLSARVVNALLDTRRRTLILRDLEAEGSCGVDPPNPRSQQTVRCAARRGTWSLAMKRIALVVSLAATSACTPAGEEPVLRQLSVQDVAGQYGQSGHIGYLKLEQDGEYECFILNGMTIDGCGTFAGAGLSKGKWEIDGTEVLFTPTSEPTDLVVKLATASAISTDGGLVLKIGGGALHLAKESVAAVQAHSPLHRTSAAAPAAEPPGR